MMAKTVKAARKRKRGVAAAESADDTQQQLTCNANKKQKQSKATTRSSSLNLPIFHNTAHFQERPMDEDLKREAELYEYLGSEYSDERIAAANVIISALLSGEGVSESLLRRHLERRLIRGLASGRKAARLGFSLALTEILSQVLSERHLGRQKFPGLGFETVFSILSAKTKADGGVGAQEEKDHALGLLFGLQCFVRAQIVGQEDGWWRAVLEGLLELEKKKSWTRAECGWIVVEAIQQLSQRQVEYTLGRVQDAGLGLSPEGVGIWITARLKFPGMKFPKAPWGQNGNPLENLKSLALALKESSPQEQEGKEEQQAKQTGSWNPQLHFVWDIVLGQYCKTLQVAVDEKTAKVDFPTFWKVAVDESLFSTNASNERKAWGLTLFRKVLQDCELYSSSLSTIFSPNLMRCLSNHMQNHNRFLHLAASSSLKALSQAAESSPIYSPLFIEQLLRSYTGSFQQKAKIVEKLLDTLAERTIEVLTRTASHLEGLDDRNSEIRRQEYGHYLVYLTNKAKAPGVESSATAYEATQAIFRIAYGDLTTWTPPVSANTRSHFKDRLISALTNSLQDLSSYQIPCQVLLDHQVAPDAVDMDQAVRAEYDRAIHVIRKLLRSIKKAQKTNGEDMSLNSVRALALLFGLAILLLLNGEPEAVTALQDLHMCYDILIRQKEEKEDSAKAFEVLVELLLSLSAKPSVLFRHANQLVFTAFATEITAPAIKLLSDVLSKSENLKGLQEMFDQDLDDADVVMEDESDAEQLDSDVEIVVNYENERKVHGHEILENDAESNCDDNEVYTDDELPEGDQEQARLLNEALAQALGTSGKGDNDAREADSDADMTDSEMLELDTKLVEIFKQTKKSEKRKDELKHARESVINFKRRVLDLLEIYLKKQAGNSIAFDILLPLLQLIRTTHEPSLARRAADMISAFSKAARTASTDLRVIAEPGTFTSEKLKLLKDIHKEASSSISNLSKKSTSIASMLVASGIYRADKNCIEKIAKIYHKTELQWLKGEINIQAAFFVDWVNWCQSHAPLAGGKAAAVDKS